jgi:hypothetical protein
MAKNATCWFLDNPPSSNFIMNFQPHACFSSSWSPKPTQQSLMRLSSALNNSRPFVASWILKSICQTALGHTVASQAKHLEMPSAGSMPGLETWGLFHEAGPPLTTV